MAEKEKKLEYKPQQKVQTPTYTGLSDDVIKTGEEYSSGSSRQSASSSSFQSTEQSGSSDSRSKVTFDPNAVRDLKGQKDVFADLLNKSHTISADDDSVLRKIGQMRRERERTLKDNLRRSAGREARKLKYNAWTNFLTSLGNIAGLGNAVPIKTDNARTVESFNRLQDMYDAAANLQNDPTLTWLDKENLSRIAAIEAYNAQAKQNDVSAENALLSNAASRVGYEQQTTGNTSSSGATVGGSSSYQAGVQSGIKQEGLTPEGAAIKAAAKTGSNTGSNAKTVNLISNDPNAPLIGITDRDANTIISDLYTHMGSKNRESGLVRYQDKFGNTRGADIGKIADALEGKEVSYIDEHGEVQDVKLSSGNIKSILLMATGNSGESAHLARQLASLIASADKEGVYYKYFSGEGYAPQFVPTPLTPPINPTDTTGNRNTNPADTSGQGFGTSLEDLL